MCKIMWHSILIFVLYHAKHNHLLFIGATLEHLINHIEVDHFCTFVLPTTLQMQISLSKLSSIVDLSVARIGCLYIFMWVLLEYSVQERVSEYTHLYGCFMDHSWMYFTSVATWFEIQFSFHHMIKDNSVFLLLLRTHFGHYNPPSLDMYYHSYL